MQSCPWTRSRRRAAAAAAAALPDDLLAVVLERLPARSLARSRGVCKRWRDLIDDRRLLLRFLLPHSVRGLFISYHDYFGRSHFLSRPMSPEYDGGSRRRINAEFEFIEREYPYSWHEVVDHCNGLVLLLDRHADLMNVCNPTTRWSARLPPPAAGISRAWGHRARAFLVFDPSVSPEYKVLLSPVEPEKKQMRSDDACRLMEWPPARWTWHEFSSSTGRWEEKAFVREGEAAGTAWDLLLYENQWGFRVKLDPPCRYAAYWEGALYVHGRGEFISRLSLLDDKYRVIKSPVQHAECKSHGVRSFLGRSEKGVYIAATACKPLDELRVWRLSESSDQTEWVSKDQSNNLLDGGLKTSSWWMENNKFDEEKYWILDFDDDERKNQDVSLVDQNVCWNSDDDNIVDASEYKKYSALPCVVFLGFHPYKEVIFLCSDGNVVAFHLNTPKVQYLGTVHSYTRHISESFVYTPCLIGD